MVRGWIKLWRKLIDDEVFQDSVLLKILIWCLLKACHKVESFPVRTGRGITTVTLEPGQLLFGRNQAAKELKIPPATVQRKMVRLEKLGFLIIQVSRHYSTISIIKWETYQGIDIEDDQATDQPTINQRSHTRMLRRKNTLCLHRADEKIPIEDGIREVLSLLNEKRTEILGNNGVKPITASGEIAARLKDGRSVYELCRVVETKAADPYFRENLKYFHPRTLFRKSNYEKYLDDSEIVRAQRTGGDQW